MNKTEQLCFVSANTWDTLAHVLLSSNSPLHSFLREAEATLTGEVIFTQRDREEERRGQRMKKQKQDHRERKRGGKGKEGTRRGGEERGGEGEEKEIKYYLLKEKNTGQEVRRIDFEAQL